MLKHLILYPWYSRKRPYSLNRPPDGSVQMYEQFACMIFGPTKLNDLPAPDPPITNTFILRLIFWLFIDMKISCAKIMLFLPELSGEPNGSVNLLLYSVRFFNHFASPCTVSGLSCALIFSSKTINPAHIVINAVRPKIIFPAPGGIGNTLNG